jgi:hypothetical protein
MSGFNDEGEYSHGAKTICTASAYHYASSEIELGRQRSLLPGTTKTSMETEETEYEE